MAAKLREKVAPRKLRELGNLLVEIIGEVMDRSVVTIPESMTVAELAGEIAAGNPALVGRQGIPIVDAQGALAGIIARSDLMRALEDDQGRGTSVLDAGTRNLIVAFPDELLRDAVGRMLGNDIGRLPIVDRHDPRRLVGYLGRAGIMRARVQLHEEENLRERGPSGNSPAGRSGGTA